MVGVCQGSLLGSVASLNPRILHHIFETELQQRLLKLGNISDETDYLKRTFLSTGHVKASSTLKGWMSESCMTAWVDGIGNVRGKVKGKTPGPAILIGSHYDTVIDGGIYDGALGILVGMSAVKAAVLQEAVSMGLVKESLILRLVDQGTLNCSSLFETLETTPKLQKSVEVVAFSDEEGVRFQSTFLGSRVLSGGLAPEKLFEIADSSGTTLFDLLLKNGWLSNVDEIRKSALKPEQYAGYLEIHMEQGPVLQQAGEALGVVTGIAGQSWGVVNIIGEQGHAGTVPMKFRRDPLMAAAALINILETICNQVSTSQNKLPQDQYLGSSKKFRQYDFFKDKSLVCTVGSVDLWPGSSNTIPGSTNFTVDIRSTSDFTRLNLIALYREMVLAECVNRNLSCDFVIKHEARAVAMNKELVQRLVNSVNAAQSAKSSQECKLMSNQCLASPNTSKVIELVSGAGHDALAMSEIIPVSMLFVRCKDGVSHSPLEHVLPEDSAAASMATFNFIQEWMVE
jgi:allantoate deiminase